MSDEFAAWATAHGPDHLRYAVSRGHVVRSAVLDTIAQMLATEIGGRTMHPPSELISWGPRANHLPDTMQVYTATVDAFSAWGMRHLPFPPGVVFMVSNIVRVEEQTDVTDPKSILKYSGVIIEVHCEDLQKRYVLVNLEAQP